MRPGAWITRLCLAAGASLVIGAGAHAAPVGDVVFKPDPYRDVDLAQVLLYDRPVDAAVLIASRGKADGRVLWGLSVTIRDFIPGSEFKEANRLGGSVLPLVSRGQANVHCPRGGSCRVTQSATFQLTEEDLAVLRAGQPLALRIRTTRGGVDLTIDPAAVKKLDQWLETRASAQ